MDKARETLVERLAQWLHDEVEWPDPDYPACSWPEHADDTGQRGDGYLKLVPQNVCEQFREIARRHPLLSDLTRLKAKVEELERERLKLRTALIETGRNLGAFLADDVSSDFLTLLPEEARLLKARLARAVEVMTAINRRLSPGSRTFDELIRETDFASAPLLSSPSRRTPMADTDKLAFQLWLHFGVCHDSRFSPSALIESYRAKMWAEHPEENWTKHFEIEDEYCLGRQSFRRIADEILEPLILEERSTDKATITALEAENKRLREANAGLTSFAEDAVEQVELLDMEGSAE